MNRYDPIVEVVSGEMEGVDFHFVPAMELTPQGEYVKAEDVLAVIKGCWDYSGGHHGNDEHLEIYRHGMQTVLNAMNGALKCDPSDLQSNVLLSLGRKTNETGILPNGERVN